MQFAGLSITTAEIFDHKCFFTLFYIILIGHVMVIGLLFTDVNLGFLEILSILGNYRLQAFNQ